MGYYILFAPRLLVVMCATLDDYIVMSRDILRGVVVPFEASLKGEH